MEFWKVLGEPPGPTSASLWRITWSFWACKYPSYKKSFNPMSFLGPRYRRSFGAVWTGPWNLIPYSLKIKVLKKPLLTPCLMTSLDSSLAVLRAMHFQCSDSCAFESLCCNAAGGGGSIKTPSSASIYFDAVEIHFSKFKHQLQRSLLSRLRTSRWQGHPAIWIGNIVEFSDVFEPPGQKQQGT